MLEEDHYYPFGLNIETATIDPALKNNIKFTSKELQRDEFTNAAGTKSGIEWEDYGARMMDPQIGRWNGVDALADEYANNSGYSYGLNNPTIYMDPNGMENMIYIINFSSSGISNEEMQRIVNSGNEVLKNMGLNTQFSIFKDDPATFDSKYLDKTDAVGLFGSINDVIGFMKKNVNDEAVVNNAEREFKEGVHETTQYNGTFIPIIPANMNNAMMSVDGSTSEEDRSVFTMLHGAWHISNPGSEYNVHSRQVDNVLSWDGRYQQGDHDLSGDKLNYGKKDYIKGFLNNLPLHYGNTTVNRNDGYKKDLIEGHFGNKQAQANYYMLKAFYEKFMYWAH